MTFASYVGKKDNAKTIFVNGVFAALATSGLTDRQKVEFIEKEMAKLDAELNKIDAEYDLACGRRQVRPI
jgi:hypothetical protein